jgi:hypothetical protein
VPEYHMNKPRSGATDKTLKLILELSAGAQIQRRGTAREMALAAH